MKFVVFFILLATCGGSQKNEKRSFAGAPRTPAKGYAPLYSL
jgi:hypothetical protein